MRVSSGTHMTMSGEAPKSATLCGINCPVAVFGPAKPLFLCGGEGQKLHQGRDLSLVTRFADSYSTYGWLLCHFTTLTIKHTNWVSRRLDCSDFLRGLEPLSNRMKGHSQLGSACRSCLAMHVCRAATRCISPASAHVPSKEHRQARPSWNHVSYWRGAAHETDSQ